MNCSDCTFAKNNKHSFCHVCGKKWKYYTNEELVKLSNQKCNINLSVIVDENTIPDKLYRDTHILLNNMIRSGMISNHYHDEKEKATPQFEENLRHNKIKYFIAWRRFDKAINFDYKTLLKIFVDNEIICPLYFTENMELAGKNSTNGKYFEVLNGIDITLYYDGTNFLTESDMMKIFNQKIEATLLGKTIQIYDMKIIILEGLFKYIEQFPVLKQLISLIK